MAGGDLVNSDLAADIRSPSISWWFSPILRCNENQEVTIESFWNEGGCKTNVVLIDLKHDAEVPVFQVGKNVTFASEQFFDTRKPQGCFS